MPKKNSGASQEKKTRLYASCTSFGCRLKYTADTLEDAGHHCICGKMITWNDSQSKDNPTFSSYRDAQ